MQDGVGGTLPERRQARERHINTGFRQGQLPQPKFTRSTPPVAARVVAVCITIYTNNTYKITYIHPLKSFACKLFAAVQHPAARCRTCKPQCPLFLSVFLVMITYSPVLARV